MTCAEKAREDSWRHRVNLLARPALGPGIEAHYGVCTSTDFVAEYGRF